jgi:regulator of cell morphogenesis and NO signaling
MNAPTTAVELVDHILTRFHETHRRELPAIVALARELEAQGATPTLAADLEAMAQALEMHMFKEEMRLFPMMEQGGNTLIAHLIDDMEAEHRSHADVAAEFERRLADLAAPAGNDAAIAALRAALGKLLDDLAQHMRLEEDVLFAMFRPPAARAASP